MSVSIFLFNGLSRHPPGIREPFRPHSLLSGVAVRTICGLAAGGYRLAIEAAQQRAVPGVR